MFGAESAGRLGLVHPDEDRLGGDVVEGLSVRAEDPEIVDECEDAGRDQAEAEGDYEFIEAKCY